MALPPSKVSTGTVELSGGVVEIRGLTFNEAREMRGERANAVAIAYATGCTEDEAQAWIDTALAGDFNELIEAVLKASRLDEGAQKSERPGDVPGDARGAE